MTEKTMLKNKTVATTKHLSLLQQLHVVSNYGKAYMAGADVHRLEISSCKD